MAITGAARRAWSKAKKASSYWSWHRIPSTNFSSPPLPPFSFDLCRVWSRFPTPLLFSPLNPTSSFTIASTGQTLPFNKWVAYSGPLFLCSPSWQLSQSATPLYPPGKFVWKQQSPRQGILNAFVKKHLPLRENVTGLQVADGSVISCGRTVLLNGVYGYSVPNVNLPNAISVARMVSGPLLGWMIVNELYTSAFMGLVFAGASDWLDGYVARKMKINSVLGSYLDPLADKVLIICVALAMIRNGLLHPALVTLVVVRDCSLVGGAFYKRAQSLGWKWKNWGDFVNVEKDGSEKIEPLLISKVNTVFQLALVGTALLQPEIGTEDSLYLVTCLSWLVAATTLASWAWYGLLLFQKGSQTATISSRVNSLRKSRDSH